VARNDPTDTGGLFIGRRPGTGPVAYRETPQRGGPRRRAADRVAALAVLALEALICLSLWGPQPAAWLWVGSQVDYRTGSVAAGIVVAFAGMIATLLASLAAATRLDAAWKILRRAGGHEQKAGALPRLFAATAVIAGAAFLIWFVLIEGPGPTVAPALARP
jgi:hypothetical protein